VRSARDPRRAASHLNHQASGDALRQRLAAATAEAARDLLIWRLDAADLVADRGSIDAMSRVSVGPARGRGVERRSGERAATVVTERIQAEMAAEHQRAALRADVLLAVAAVGHDLAS
jgi:hypothetical protein